jgi:chemotaxis protein methyltransferase CheR
MLTEEQFVRSRRLAERVAGVVLFERHRELLERRRQRLGIGGAGLDTLLRRVEEAEPAAVREFIGWITTNHTAFFRHPWQLDTAAEHALWAAHRHGRAQLWSAAAASGEEPYSLAMALIEVFRRDVPPAGILATDIDEVAVERARLAEYGERPMRAIGLERRERFFTKTVTRRWVPAAVVRRLVEFQLLNLAAASWPLEGPFDVILSRNVLMYLEAGHRYAVLERMASLLAPDGLLILDPAEHPGPAGHFFTAGRDGVYSRRRAVSRQATARGTCLDRLNPVAP